MSLGLSASRWRLVAVAAASAMILTACGSGDSKNASAGLEGDPIVLGQIIPIDNPNNSNPGYRSAAQLAARYINENGGIDGRPLKVETCDDRVDPNQATVCARKLLQEDDALALVGSLSSQGPNIYPILKETGKVSFGNMPVVPEDFNNPLSYPISAGTGATIFASMVKPDDVTAIVHASTPGGTYAGQTIKASFDAAGRKAFKVEVDGAASDMQPFCRKIAQQGATAVIAFIADVISTRLVPACVQINELRDAAWYAGGIQMPVGVMDAYEKAGIEANVELDFGTDPEEYPAVAAYREAIEKYGDDVDPTPSERTQTDFVAFVAVYALANVLKDLDDVTPDALRERLDGGGPVETGATLPIDYSGEGFAGLPRLKNARFIPGVFRDRKLQTLPGADWVSAAQ